MVLTNREHSALSMACFDLVLIFGWVYRTYPVFAGHLLDINSRL